MRKLARPALVAVLIASVFGVSEVLGDEYNAGGTIVTGTGIQTAVVGKQAKVMVQCPNLDAGTGQKVWYRPGGCAGCVVDAGQGDELFDFANDTKGRVVQLRTNPSMDRIHLRGFLAADAIWCTVIPTTP